MLPKKRIGAVLLFLALVLGAGLHLSPGTGAPFDRSFQGWNPAWYGIAARNLLRRGLVELRFGMVLDCGFPSPKPVFYTDHPPLTALLCAGSFALFGEGEVQARGIALLLSALSAGLFFLFLRELPLSSLSTAFLGTALYLGTPLAAYYGNMLDPQGSGVLFSMAGSLWAAARWARLGKRGDLLLSLAFLTFGLFYDWPAFLLAGFLGFWALRAFPGRPLLQRISFWLLAGAAGILLLAWILSLQGEAPSQGGGLWAALKHRSILGGLRDAKGRPLALSTCLEGIWRHHAARFFLPVSFLGILGVLVALRNSPKAPPASRLLWIPLLVGLAQVFLFLQGAYSHDYWQIYLAPGLALPAAWLLGRTAAPGSGLRPWAGPLLLLLGCLVLVLGHLRAEKRWEGQRPALMEARSAGRILREISPPDRFVVSSALPAVAVNFYSDRQIVWGMKTPALLEKIFGPWKKTGPFVGAFLLEPRALPAWRPFLSAHARKPPARAGSFLIFGKGE